MDHAEIRQTLLDAIEPHVAFDGWSETSFDAAIQDAGLDPLLAKAACTNGAYDLAVVYHERGDAAMRAAYDAVDTDDLKIREKVALAIRLRLDRADPELVRRGMTLFSLPMNATDGTRLLWGTADAIWTVLGDTSEDYNWYTKRMTLSGVYGSTVMFWLGDQSDQHTDTWAFLDRRIENIMQFEKAKASAAKIPIFSSLIKGLERIKAPSVVPSNLPGQLKDI